MDFSRSLDELHQRGTSSDAKGETTASYLETQRQGVTKLLYQMLSVQTECITRSSYICFKTEKVHLPIALQQETFSQNDINKSHFIDLIKQQFLWVFLVVFLQFPVVLFVLNLLTSSNRTDHFSLSRDFGSFNFQDIQ